MDAPPLRCLFLGYLWKVARAIQQSPRARLLAVGVEPQRARSAEAIRYFLENGVPLFEARKQSPLTQLEELLGSGIDVLVVGAFGRILPPELLARPRFGAINVHCSLLPAYRGGCPIEEQILAGDTHGGVTLHWMTENIDAGPILTSRPLSISSDDAYSDVFERCHTRAELLLAEVLQEHPSRWPRIEQGTPTPIRRPRDVDDGVIDWGATAFDIKRLVLADGWRGWVRTNLPEGDFVVEQVSVVDAGGGDARSPGSVLVGGDAPVIQTGQGAIKVLKTISPRPLVAGERLPSNRATP